MKRQPSPEIVRRVCEVLARQYLAELEREQNADVEALLAPKAAS